MLIFALLLVLLPFCVVVVIVESGAGSARSEQIKPGVGWIWCGLT